MSEKITLDEKNAICPAAIRYGPPNNRHVNELFPSAPSLLEFCEVMEEESRRVARRLQDIDAGKEKRPVYKEVTIPQIPPAYLQWKEDNSE